MAVSLARRWCHARLVDMSVSETDKRESVRELRPLKSVIQCVQSWLPDPDRGQAPELCKTADVLHCGRYPHFLGGELLALLDK